MSDFVACYKSGHRLVIEAWEAYEADHERFSRELKVLTAEMWPSTAIGEGEVGFKPVPIISTSSWDPGRQTLYGWSWRFGVTPPEGWKTTDDSNTGYAITPKRSTKAGKAIVKRMESVGRVEGLNLPGMPLKILALPSIHSCAGERHGDCIYIGWGIDPETIDVRSTPGGKNVDLSLWKRIKVSEFFAAREDDERVEASVD